MNAFIVTPDRFFGHCSVRSATYSIAATRYGVASLEG
jgi:hypothetical protein